MVRRGGRDATDQFVTVASLVLRVAVYCQVLDLPKYRPHLAKIARR